MKIPVTYFSSYFPLIIITIFFFFQWILSCQEISQKSAIVIEIIKDSSPRPEFEVSPYSPPGHMTTLPAPAKGQPPFCSAPPALAFPPFPAAHAFLRLTSALPFPSHLPFIYTLFKGSLSLSPPFSCCFPPFPSPLPSFLPSWAAKSQRVANIVRLKILISTFSDHERPSNAGGRSGLDGKGAAGAGRCLRLHPPLGFPFPFLFTFPFVCSQLFGGERGETKTRGEKTQKEK